MDPATEFRLHLDTSRHLTSGRINTHVDACERTQMHVRRRMYAHVHVQM